MKKRLIFYAFFAMRFTQCVSHNEKKINSTDSIIFETATASTQALKVAIKAEAAIKSQELSANIKLENNSEKNIHIEAVEVATVEGYLAKQVGDGIKTIVLSANGNTTFDLKFMPVNDAELFNLTGETGKLKQQYQLTIFYKEGDDKTGSVKLPLNIPEKDYAVYEKNYKQRTTAYKIDTAAFQVPEQKKQLQTLFAATPFLHISNQEIAIAGLNFKLQLYQLDDSIHAKIFIVNHADFEIKLDTSLLNIIICANGRLNKNRCIAFIKTSGTKQQENIMRKGDRVEITVTKYYNAIACEKLELIFRNAFLLPGNRSLFYADMTFIKI